MVSEFDKLEGDVSQAVENKMGQGGQQNQGNQQDQYGQDQQQPGY